MTTVREVLVRTHPESLVDELIAAYGEAKTTYYAGVYRLSSVAGGRFCEAAYRLLEEIVDGRHTALGDGLNTSRLQDRLARSPHTHDRAVRHFIPRALRVAYDVRNNRGVAHLAAEIDSNVQDATLVVTILDWVLAEFVRLSGSADL
ncbi:hypothetical protein G3I76_54060, partial [Streptomyces sp. SID11233]|nr:hypothetical protein [Streptomyces sp. SID11233]